MTYRDEYGNDYRSEADYLNKRRAIAVDRTIAAWNDYLVRANVIDRLMTSGESRDEAIAFAGTLLADRLGGNNVPALRAYLRERGWFTTTGRKADLIDRITTYAESLMTIEYATYAAITFTQHNNKGAR
jgi:hypothetical protein